MNPGISVHTTNVHLSWKQATDRCKTSEKFYLGNSSNKLKVLHKNQNPKTDSGLARHEQNIRAFVMLVTNHRVPGNVAAHGMLSEAQCCTELKD